MNKAWKKNSNNIVMQLQDVKEDSIVFNKEHFGNIFAKKKQIEARLKGIQRTLEQVDSAYSSERTFAGL